MNDQPDRQPDDIPSWIDAHLRDWARSIRTGGLRELMAPSHASGFIGGGYSADSDTRDREGELYAVRVVDGLVSSLTASQQCAINHRYLDAVYRWPRDNYVEQLQAAVMRLAAGMSARGLV